MAKQKFLQRKYMTKKGVASYPHVVKPDPRYGGYKTGLIQPLSVGQELIDILEEMAEEEFGKAKAKRANLPFEIDEDEGTVKFKFSGGDEYPPKLFDIYGNPVKEKLAVGGGTVMKINTLLRCYDTGKNFGVKAYLNEVQILKLVEYQGGGFGSAEGELDDDEEGYTAGSAGGFGDASEEDQEQEDEAPRRSSKRRNATDF